MKYLVVFEKTGNSFGAYVPDLPGCVAAARSHEAVCLLIQEAIDLHLQDLQAQGLLLVEQYLKEYSFADNPRFQFGAILSVYADPFQTFNEQSCRIRPSHFRTWICRIRN